MAIDTLLSVEEARERILAFVTRLPTEEKPLADALGQVLADDVVSPLTIPPLDNTSMDGYAVRAADVWSAGEAMPVRLAVVGELAAGSIYQGEVVPGTAVRIMTGAPVPEGADAIVPFEETDEADGRTIGSFARGRTEVNVLKAPALGANIRLAGEDVQAGSLVLRAGTVLNAAQIGVLASLGKAKVSVYRRPVVALLSTGDELLELDAPYETGKIYDSNTYGLEALIKEAGGTPLRLGIARDTYEDVKEKLRRGFEADLIVTSAGVSRGDHDVVKEVLQGEGQIGFWSVSMRPGRPLAFGSLDAGGRKIPHIGLPGNPVSSLVTFELFGRPAMFKMMGRDDWQRPSLRVRVAERITNSDERRTYARAIVREQSGELVASLTGNQSSGVLTSMALANALVICPQEKAALEAGEEAEAMMLGPVVREGT